MGRPLSRARLAALVLATGALAATGAALAPRPAAAASRTPSAATMISPDDPNIRYTEYVHATVTHTDAVFDRPGVPNGNAIASPDTRVNFRTDATRVSLLVYYTFACGALGCGHFSVERDGRLLPPSFGTDVGSGSATYLIATQPTPALRSYSVIWPYGTQMVFRGLLLEGGKQRLVGPAPARPARRYVAYGDSITQGYYAASGTIHTYPDQVARRKNWSVVNMGFGGETTVPSDGTAVGLLNGSIVTIAIGVNDFGQSKPLANFQSDYNALLDSVRALQPTVPIYCLTPIWTTLDAVQNGQFLFLSSYRQVIAQIVQQRAVVDPNLHLIDGLALVPHDTRYFVDGIHPNDAGFSLYASNLAARLPS